MTLNHPDWYDGPDDIHLSIEKRGAFWFCTNCGKKEKNPNRLIHKPGCTKKHSNCPYCGCGPVCASDCPGIAEILGDPKVYLAGFGPTEH